MNKINSHKEIDEVLFHSIYKFKKQIKHRFENSSILLHVAFTVMGRLLLCKSSFFSYELTLVEECRPPPIKKSVVICK